MKNKKRIIVAITGASGSIYPHNLLKKFVTLKGDIEAINNDGKSILNLSFEDETTIGFNSKLPKRK